MTAALFAALLVTFPAENQKLPATARTYVIGAAETNRRERLYLNDVEIDVYRTGAFLTMVKVSPGENTLTFSQGTNTLVRRFTVAPPPQPSTHTPQPPAKPHDPYADLGIPTNAVFAAKPPPGTPPKDVHVMVDAGQAGPDSGALTPGGLKE